MESPLIEFKNVTKRFDDHTVLDGVSLTIDKGYITTIIGKSGTGKTVLLKHIIGLLTPDEGQVLYRGKPLDTMSKREFDAYLGKISYMFQNNALFDSMTVFENIALPLRQTTTLSSSEIRRKVMERVEQTELTDFIDKYPSELSGGMQKRVALSRALVTDPEIVLFDEPTTGQDIIRRNAILSMVAQYQNKFGFTAVLISHDLPDVFFISNRVIVLYGSEVIFQGPPKELDNFDHPFMLEFIDSLEGLQEKLTGLHSKRHFKIRYQRALRRKDPHKKYAVVVFSLEDMETLSEVLGHTVAQEVLRSMGDYINKHFGAVGGFSSRQSKDQIGTVLPHSDLNEAEQILEDFNEDLQKNGLAMIEADGQSKMPHQACFEFSISAGLAEGTPRDEIELIFNNAKQDQKRIAQFVCS